MTSTVIYTRISQDREGEALGVERQEQACRELAARCGLTVTDVYCDNDAGASTRSRKRRPHYERLLRDVDSGHVGTVLAYSLSRLTRRPMESEGLIQRAETRGLAIRTVASGDPDLTRADGRATFRTIGAWDAAEAERTGERVTAAQAQASSMGKPHGGKRRLGYSADSSALVPAEAEFLTWCYRQMLDGATLGSLAAEGKRRGLTGPLGAPLAHHTVRQALKRAWNAGLVVYRGEVVGSHEYPTITDVDTYWQVQALLADPARKRSRGKPATTLLVGALVCEVCESAIRGSAKHRAGKERILTYGCPAGHVWRPRADMDDWFGSLIVAHLVKNKAKILRPAKQEAGPTVDVPALEQKIERYQQLAISGALAPDDFTAIVGPLRAQLAEARRVGATPPARPAAARLVQAKDVQAAWQALDVDGQRAVVAELLKSIRMDRGTGAFDGSGLAVAWQSLA